MNMDNMEDKSNKTLEELRKENEILKAKLNKLSPLAVTAYNRAGIVPAGSVFKVDVNSLKKAIYETAKTFLDDIQQVTIDTSPKTGHVMGYVWFPKDSKHLRDVSTMSERSAIRKPVTRFSPELKKFIDRFCPDNQKHIIQTDERDIPLVGLAIRVERFVELMFNNCDAEYAKDFNTNIVRTHIKPLTAMFDKNSFDGKFGNLKYVQIVKEVSNRFNRKEPHPRRSVNI